MKNRDVLVIDSVISSPEGISLTYIVKKSGLPKTTGHRTLANLTGEKLLFRDAERLYSRGSVLLRWINAHKRRYIDIFRPHITHLARETGETVPLLQRQESLKGVSLFPLIGAEEGSWIARRERIERGGWKTITRQAKEAVALKEGLE